MIAVIIPTRNRPSELSGILECLTKQDSDIEQIIVVDSSDTNECERLCSESNLIIDYTRTEIRSAAIQRNLGISVVRDNINHVAFLDDDVVIQPSYLRELTSELVNTKGIGISGVAINPNSEVSRKKPMGFVGFFHRLFLLDSVEDGKLLASGVNIPVRTSTCGTIEVDWLIGCSVWNFQSIKSLRFEKDFFGQSLGEDVIFSYLASKQGSLLTNPRVIISHFESGIGRPDPIEFYRMWTRNRFRLIQIMDLGLKGRFSYIWANCGQSIILIYLYLRRKTPNLKPVNVIVTETFRMLSLEDSNQNSP